MGATLIISVPIRFENRSAQGQSSQVFLKCRSMLFLTSEFLTMPQGICTRTPQRPTAQTTILHIQAFRIHCFTIGKARILKKQSFQKGLREQSHAQRAVTIPARERDFQNLPGAISRLSAVPCEPAQSAEPQQQQLDCAAVAFMQ